MITFIIICLLILLGLIVSLFLPGGMQDINLGLYIVLFLLFSIACFVIIVRKVSGTMHIFSDYAVIILCMVIAAEAALIGFSFDSKGSGKKEAIIVVGSGLFVESRMTDELKARLDKALDLSKKNPDLPIVLSGGKSDHLALPQCVAMKDYLVKKAADRDIELPEIISDGASLGIYENITTSLSRANVKNAYIIVSDHNVPRTKLIVNRVAPGSAVIGAELPPSKYLIYYLREIGPTLKTIATEGT